MFCIQGHLNKCICNYTNSHILSDIIDCSWILQHFNIWLYVSCRVVSYCQSAQHNHYDQIYRFIVLPFFEAFIRMNYSIVWLFIWNNFENFEHCPSKQFVEYSFGTLGHCKYVNLCKINSTGSSLVFTIYILNIYTSDKHCNDCP